MKREFLWAVLLVAIFIIIYGVMLSLLRAGVLPASVIMAGIISGSVLAIVFYVKNEDKQVPVITILCGITLALAILVNFPGLYFITAVTLFIWLLVSCLAFEFKQKADRIKLAKQIGLLFFSALLSAILIKLLWQITLFHYPVI
jgi:hypothetical protein